MPTLTDKVKAVFAPPPGETLNLFQASATIFPISAIYLYFSGYTFCYFYYYRFFGVTLESLDLSPQFYLIRAYTSLRSLYGLGLLAIVFLAITLYLHGRLRTGITLAVMVAAFPALYFVSYHQAWSEYKATFCNPSSTIRFRFKESKESSDLAAKPEGAADKNPAGQNASHPNPAAAPVLPPQTKPSESADDPASKAGLMQREEEDRISLLLETKDRIVVFLKPSCVFGPEPPQAHIYTLARADLEFTTVAP